jgi:heme-degrading monooxygenase HmoA
MIVRTWRGTVHLADADEYAKYIRATGFAGYGQTPGNRGAWMLRRDDGDRTEFITLSLWNSVDAIRAFAGDDIDAAVLYPEDARYLVGGSTVTHYQIVDQVEPAPGSGEGTWGSISAGRLHPAPACSRATPQRRRCVV